MHEARIPPRYIVVEGPIGVGKTSLVERLAEAWDDAVRGETERVARRLGGGGVPPVLSFLPASAGRPEP